MLEFKGTFIHLAPWIWKCGQLVIKLRLRCWGWIRLPAALCHVRTCLSCCVLPLPGSSERTGAVSALGLALLPSDEQRALQRHWRFLFAMSDLHLSLAEKISLLSVGKQNFKDMGWGFGQDWWWETNHSRYFKHKDFNTGCEVLQNHWKDCLEQAVG